MEKCFISEGDMIYLENNVFEEALERIRFVYDNFSDVIVSMSGGKDSTVLFNLALTVAKEKGRLPLKVFWLDQECEWQSTVDYMESIMTREDVKPYWFQIPFDFTNSLSAKNNFIRLWDESAQDKWVHPRHPLAITENPSKFNRFHDLVENLCNYCTDDENVALLVGMKINESFNRRTAITQGRYTYKGQTWCKKPRDKVHTFWPIYDFSNEDIWTAIAKNHWTYNKVYDWQYQKSVSNKDMRVSALIHETSWHAIEFLQEFEPKTYERFVKRVAGVSTFNHSFDMGDIIPRELPFAFSSWQEYRDYLLVNITKPEYWDLFKRRWKNQDGDEWYKVHVKEIIINDIDGTINANKKSTMRKRSKVQEYHDRDEVLFNKWKEGKEDD